MSISLNNHEYRIEKLEDRPSGSGISSQTLDTRGHASFTNGLIVQWGIDNSVLGGKSRITFPKSFPNKVFSVVATPVAANTSGLAGLSFGISNINNNGFDVYCGHYGAASYGNKAHWIAIGY